MPRRLLRAVCLVLVVALAPASTLAAPSQEELATRAAALKKRLAGQRYTVLVEPPFVVIGDEPPQRVRDRARFVRWVVRLLEQDYFATRPTKVIEVWLFRDESTYRRGAKRFWGAEPSTPYGYYSSHDGVLVMNIGPGAGTLSHEIVHPYIEANLPDAPAWFNEGLASLYEQPREREGHLWGTTNWRLPALQKMIRERTLPSLASLISTTPEGFYGASYDSYAYARFVCQYLQDHGKLRAFYRTLAADTEDRTGRRALETVLGQDLATFDPVFRRWALALRR